MSVTGKAYMAAMVGLAVAFVLRETDILLLRPLPPNTCNGSLTAAKLVNFAISVLIIPVLVSRSFPNRRRGSLLAIGIVAFVGTLLLFYPESVRVICPPL